jgi:hypothetical protein
MNTTRSPFREIPILSDREIPSAFRHRRCHGIGVLAYLKQAGLYPSRDQPQVTAVFTATYRSRLFPNCGRDRILNDVSCPFSIS